MKLAQSTMDDYAGNVLELLRYVAYIKDKKSENSNFPWWISPILQT
jgi:hypothetical protein